MPVSVAVIGGSGYTGAELLRLLHGHPEVEVAAVCAQRNAGARLDQVFPQFAGVSDATLEAFDAEAVASRAEVAFTGLPHGQSASAVAALRAAGAMVIDLSADFRLRDAEVYRSWYGSGAEHPAAELLGEAVYGLPERYRDAIREAGLVACPGCYPTSAILAAAPLLAAGVIEPSGLVVDAKSGVSGAGRGATRTTHFAEVGEGVRAYKLAGLHRHTPEMEQELSAARGGAVSLTFTPHLVPMSRGILTCVYARPGDPGRPAADYGEVLQAAYRDEPFVTVLGNDALPDTSHVRGSNRAQVAVRVDERAGLVIAIAAIDNLVKGAAGQAVQCLNLSRGWEETTGLERVALFP